MNLLIKSATISDPGSPFYQQVADVLIEKGQIIKIAKTINADIESFDAKGKHLAPGFFDLNCNIGELGLETKEDLQTGTRAAAAGGFTGVVLMPNTLPPVHSTGRARSGSRPATGRIVRRASCDMGLYSLKKIAALASAALLCR